jgi:hypothetical protein
VGVKSSTVHYYLPTKADLLREASGEYKTGSIAALDQGARDSTSFRHDMLVLVDGSSGGTSGIGLATRLRLEAISQTTGSLRRHRSVKSTLATARYLSKSLR